MKKYKDLTEFEKYVIDGQFRKLEDFLERFQVDDLNEVEVEFVKEISYQELDFKIIKGELSWKLEESIFK